MFYRNGYRLGEKIGTGSFAVVRKALNSATGRPMAVKIIDHNLATKEVQEKFLPRELEIISTLKHANIIEIEKIVRFGPYTCVIMEQAKEGDLLEYILRKGSMTESVAKRIIVGIVKALQYCHFHNIAHRDLKCENILLGEHGEPKLSDFGFARCVSDPVNKKRLLSRTFCGSAAYVPPEVLRGTPYNPMMSDVWSLGVIFFIVVTGLMPFDDSNLPKMVESQIKKKWTFPKNCKEKLSAECQHLIKKMLEPNVVLRVTINQLANNEWLKSDHSGEPDEHKEVFKESNKEIHKEIHKETRDSHKERKDHKEHK